MTGFGSGGFRFGASCLLAAAFWPASAGAQPVFRYEHDWTLLAGERIYGLRQVLQLPGGARRTQVWLGRCSFEVEGRAAGVVFGALASPLGLARRVDWDSFRLLR